MLLQRMTDEDLRAKSPAARRFLIFRQKIAFLMPFELHLPAGWSSGNAFVSGTEDLGFKSQAGQIGHRVANGSPPL